MITTAATLMRQQGYAATGWRQVISESGTPWGSQAHHFPDGKEQLAAEAIEVSGRQYEAMLRSVLATGHPADAVTAWTDVAADALERAGWADGCPIATITLETAHTSDRLAAACATALDSWRSALAEAMQRNGASPPDADELATLVLASIEGALLMARAAHNPEPLHIVGRQLHDLLRTRLPSRP